MEKKFGVYMFYTFVIVGIISFPGVFINFWFFYISVPLCVLWALIFMSFLCFRALVNFFTKGNAYESIDSNLRFLGRITIKEKIIISDSLTVPYQLTFESLSVKYCTYLYKLNADVSVLIITTLILDNNSLSELFESICESKDELIVDNGCIVVFTSGNVELSNNNANDLQSNTNEQYLFLHDACFEKIGVVVYPEYGDGAYTVAKTLGNLNHSVIVELIPGSIEIVKVRK